MSERFVLRARLFGGVQGVGFRGYCQGTAAGLDLKGFVRNEAGGSVFVEAVGERQKLEQLAKKLKKGFAVDRVEKKIEKFEGIEPKKFEIKY